MFLTNPRLHYGHSAAKERFSFENRLELNTVQSWEEIHELTEDGSVEHVVESADEGGIAVMG